MQKIAQKKSLIFGVRNVSKLDICEMEKMNEESGRSLNHVQIVTAIKDIDSVILSVEYQEKFIGYAIYKKKDGYIKIVDICIDPYYRRQGAGTTILDYIKKCSAFKIHGKIMICVEESNLDCHLFLRVNCFKCTSIDKYGKYKFQYEEEKEE